MAFQRLAGMHRYAIGKLFAECWTAAGWLTAAGIARLAWQNRQLVVAAEAVADDCHRFRQQWHRDDRALQHCHRQTKRLGDRQGRVLRASVVNPF